MLPPPRRKRLRPQRPKIDEPRYRYYEDGEITKVYGNGTYDVTVAGRPYPYEGIGPSDRESVFDLGEQVRIGFLEDNPYLPQIVGRIAGRHPAPFPGRPNDSGKGPNFRKKPGDRSLPKKVKLLPGWLTWGAYSSFGRYVAIKPDEGKDYLSEDPVPAFDLQGSGMLRTFETMAIGMAREMPGPDDQPHYVILGGTSALVPLWRFDYTWEPYVPGGPYGGNGLVPMDFSLSDDAKLAVTLWGATNGGNWASTAPEPNIGGPECREE